MIRGLIKKIADKYIHRSLQPEREVRAINLRRARKVALLFNATDKSNYLELKRLMNDIESHNSKTELIALGWYKGKHMPEFVKDSARVKLFNFKDYNLLFRPKKKAVNIHNFTAGQYDLLIDLTKNDLYPLRKVCSMVKSSFRVGAFVPGNEPFYDFMIKHRNQKDFVNQIIHYLSLLNKNEKQ